MKDYTEGFKQLVQRKRSDLVDLYEGLLEVLEFFPEGNDLESLYTMLQDLLAPSRNLLNPVSVYLLSATKGIDIEEIFQILAKSRYPRFAPLLELLEGYILESCEISNESGLIRAYDGLFDVLRQTWWTSSDGGKTGENFSQGTVSSGGTRSHFPAVPIVTTNYDLGVEVYLNRKQVEFEDGFRRGAGGVLRFDPDVLKSLSDPSVSLHKLHGSIDWKRTERGQIIQTVGRPGMTTSRLERISGDAMVFPTNQKSNLAWPFVDLLSIFLDVLRRTKFWLVIGYSFRDEALRQIFLDNLSREKHLILLSPRATSKVVDLRKNLLPGVPESHVIPIDAKFGTNESMKMLSNTVQKGL